MIKEHLNKIRNAGFFLLAITFVISTLWGSSHAFFPMLFTVILLGIVVIFKALHWQEYEIISAMLGLHWHYSFSSL